MVSQRLVLRFNIRCVRGEGSYPVSVFKHTNEEKAVVNQLRAIRICK